MELIFIKRKDCVCKFYHINECGNTNTPQAINALLHLQSCSPPAPARHGGPFLHQIHHQEAGTYHPLHRKLCQTMGCHPSTACRHTAASHHAAANLLLLLYQTVTVVRGARTMLSITLAADHWRLISIQRQQLAAEEECRAPLQKHLEAGRQEACCVHKYIPGHSRKFWL